MPFCPIYAVKAVCEIFEVSKNKAVTDFCKNSLISRLACNFVKKFEVSHSKTRKTITISPLKTMLQAMLNR